MAAAASTTSAGTITVKFTSDDITAMSSMDWAEAPSSPGVTPPCDATSFTFICGCASDMRIWSNACPA